MGYIRARGDGHRPDKGQGPNPGGSHVGPWDGQDTGCSRACAAHQLHDGKAGGNSEIKREHTGMSKYMEKGQLRVVSQNSELCTLLWEYFSLINKIKN